MRSLRRRLVVFATLTTALVLVVTAAMLLLLQRGRLVAEVDDSLVERADQLEGELATSIPETIVDPSVDERAAQVTRLDGSLITSTVNLAGRPAIAPPPRTRQSITTVNGLPFEDDEFRLLSRRITTASGPAVLRVAENIDDIDEGVLVLARSLLLAFPLMLAALAALTWWLVGRTTRPAEAAARHEERFASDASHELRAPLARMRTRLEVDLAHPSGVDLRETAAAVLADSRSMERLVDDLLLLARADAESSLSAASCAMLVDLDDLVLEAVRGVARTDVSVDATAVSGGRVRGSPNDLARVVVNLLDNAERHARGLVRIELHEAGEQVVFHVDDDGDGVPVDQREHVFRRFTRLDESRTPGAGGSGLGLAIVREIVGRHGGTVVVTDAPSGGARFTVTLPRV